MTSFFVRLLSIVLLLAIANATALAQSADVPIEQYRLSFDDPHAIGALAKMRDAHQLMSLDDVHQALEKPSPAPLKLPTASKQVLTPAQVAVFARKGLVRIGWFYLSRSGNWHVNTADGYELTDDGAVATCYHCLLPPKVSGVKEAYLFAADSQFHVYPVQAVLGGDSVLDAAIVRVVGGDFNPIPLNDQVAPGDAVYLLSDPGETAGFFSSGQINRFYWKRDGSNNPDTMAGVRNLRINVSTDWSPGSSGAAVLDSCGNAIGHVSVISTLNRNTTTSPESGGATTEPSEVRTQSQPPATYVVLHEAVPARGVRLLAESMKSSIEKVPAP